MIKRLLIPFILLVLPLNIFAFNAQTEELLQQLDSLIANSDKYIHEKEAKLIEMRKKRPSSHHLEEQLWFNKMMYDEYYVYDADSAMMYIDKNIKISRKLKRTDWEQEWLLNKVFILSASGLLVEADKNLLSIQFEKLNDNLKYRYYDIKIYLYSHLGQYIGGRPKLAEEYYATERNLRSKAEKHISHDMTEYHSFYGFLYLPEPKSAKRDSIITELKNAVDNSQLNTRIDAINAYTLAVISQNDGNENDYIKYLVYSSFADIRICNRDIASLEELSSLMYERNDINRGYTYINYCLKTALLYPNRVRVVNISSIIDKLQHAYQAKIKAQAQLLEKRYHTSVVLFFILLLTVILIYIQFRKISNSKKELARKNELLNTHVKELSETQQILASVNQELNTVNEKLKISNEKLKESNYIKEEYIGYVFSICSNYISKLENYRKNISRKIKAGQLNEIRDVTAKTSIVQQELKEFYHSFDAVFLHVYPNFVDDFNALLRPEERITLKENELLNTELRIYAIVRLGINDSVKIAEFLHCSPQTVYNNRLKTRNKAVIPKETFAETVRSLGKMEK